MTGPDATFSTDHSGRLEEITALFREAFAASEGPEEGRVIGSLSHALLTTTPAEDLLVCLADGVGGLEGAIVFTRMSYPEDKRSVFVLGPVAVAPARQGKGVGQALLRHGLERLRARGAEVALTYGDPAYYGRVGFAPISQDAVAAPYALQYPEGWLGQSLTEAPLGTIAGPATCVPGFADPAYW